MPALEEVRVGIRRSRRNLMKVGLIGASAIFANLTTTKSATADDDRRWDADDRRWDDDDRRWDADDRRWGHDRHWGGGTRDPSGGANCFLKGTTIQTAEGDRKIEDLAVGDLLPTVFGGICPIEWIGHYYYKKDDKVKPWVEDVQPVRIARSALGPNTPRADLYVTKSHALLIDGVLVTAGSLINGITITLADARQNDELEFFHIRLASHDVIYAEGAPCETVVNCDERAVNFAEYLRRFGHPTSQETRCAPVFNFNDRRGQIKSRLRSAISPWIDRRQKFDIIRDELEERAIAGLRDRSVSRYSRLSA